ncbi:MAG: hypothetical protein K2I20_01780 [Clostridia bacterium]|nr:hypothetical protein [Clostridia bacterium]MDE6356913.1 hypothetical protein [Clostridia bacterium]
MKSDKGTDGVFVRLKCDFAFRKFVFAAGSFVITLAFTAYNLFLGIAYNAVFNLGISVYYALLLCGRAFVGIFEIKYKRAGLSEEQKSVKRKKLFLATGILLLIIALALVGPISLMVRQQKYVNFTEIPAISMAAYTVYKISSAIAGFVKTKKLKHLSLEILQSFNFVDALVSVLSLQYVLIMTFGDGIAGAMFTLCAISGFAVWAVIVITSIAVLAKAIKNFR